VVVVPPPSSPPVIGGPEFPNHPTGLNCPLYSSWNFYPAGSCVTSLGRVFIALSDASPQMLPGSTAVPWMEVGEFVTDVNGLTVQRWTPTWVYGMHGASEILEFNGMLFQAIGLSRNVIPPTLGASWRYLGPFIAVR
jgi:hypothetical protein